MAIPLTTRVPLEFTPPSLPEKLKGPDPADDTKHKTRILVRVPTYLERDSYQAELVRAGVQVYTKGQIRDLCLQGVQEIYPEDERDEKTTLMRELWELQDDEQQVRSLELNILREEMEKAQAVGRELDLDEVKRRSAEIQPDVVMDPTRKIAATAATQEVLAKFKPLAEVVAGLADQDAKRAWLNARVYVRGWTGLEHQPDPPERLGLKRHEVEYLRAQIGQDAFTELSDFITSMMVIDEDEEKNLDSLLANMSAPIGSTPSELTVSSDAGNSTAGPSTTIPESGSPETTPQSSSSSTSSRTRKAASKRGLTENQSSSSQ